MVSTRLGIGPRVLSRGLACACLLLATANAGRVHAQGDGAASDRANLLFKKGKVAFNAGKFNDALRIYSEAWSLKQSPDIAANLAQTESELGQHRNAAEHFAFALAHLLPSSTDEQKQALAEGLAQEKKEIGSLHVTLEPADSALSIDDAPVTVPPSGDIYLEPGEHGVSVTHEGYEPNLQTVRLSKGSSQVLWIKLTEIGAVPAQASAEPAHASSQTDTTPPPSHHSSKRSIVPALVGGGLVAAGAAVGVVFLLSANSSQKDADQLRSTLPGSNACGTGTPYVTDCAVLHDKNSDIDRARTIEIVGFSVAGAAAVGTALYLLWPHSRSHASAASGFSPTLAIAPHATSFGLSGRF
jgi:hypothetical protein